jgi:hypothetical protein
MTRAEGGTMILRCTCGVVGDEDDPDLFDFDRDEVLVCLGCGSTVRADAIDDEDHSDELWVDSEEDQ